MVEIEDEVYTQLQKDANDNKSVLRLAKIVFMFIFSIVVLIAYGTKLIDISLESYKASVERQIAIEEAHTNVAIREIESAGMTTEEYLKWLEIQTIKKEE